MDSDPNHTAIMRVLKKKAWNGFTKTLVVLGAIPVISGGLIFAADLHFVTDAELKESNELIIREIDQIATQIRTQDLESKIEDLILDRELRREQGGDLSPYQRSRLLKLQNRLKDLKQRRR